jgi:hypothetical protein
MRPPADEAETDPRFPSGRWVGFWIQRYPPIGRHPTELVLTFRGGTLRGEGRDVVGDFTVAGGYDLASGRCHWTKHYLGRHDVAYEGFNEGRGIWGRWTIADVDGSALGHGGFHIWPAGMPDPTGGHLTEQAPAPAEREEPATVVV